MSMNAPRGGVERRYLLPRKIVVVLRRRRRHRRVLLPSRLLSHADGVHQATRLLQQRHTAGVDCLAERLRVLGLGEQTAEGAEVTVTAEGATRHSTRHDLRTSAHSSCRGRQADIGRPY